MKITDIIFAAVCGIFVAWVASDFLNGKHILFLFTFLPIFSVFCLLLAETIAKRFNFILQAAKFILVGGFADIIDIKAYQFIFQLIPASLLVKSASFFIAVLIKYIGNKHWVFNKPEKESIKEVVQFLAVTFIGLGLNLASFYCATNLAGAHFGISSRLWTELSIIFAALVASVWNFSGYKFIVFKK